MICAVILLVILPSFIKCSGEGNIRILEDDISDAIQACSYYTTSEGTRNHRRRRSKENPYVYKSNDDNLKQENNPYIHEKRNANDTENRICLTNCANHSYAEYGNIGKEHGDDKSLTSIPWDVSNSNDSTNSNRTKRNEPLLKKDDSDQCLSQCVFANLQVVDSRGIPRELELWNKVQASVTSQQSRSTLRDQIHACFQELQSEAEDNGCSYSNKLERCLMLRFSDRKTKITNKKT